MARLTAALRSRLVELARSTPRSLPALTPRRRRVTVRMGASLPAWLLRAAVVVVAVGCVVLAGAGTALTVIGAAGALFLLVRPGGAAPAAVVGYVAFVLATSGDPGWSGRVFAVLLGTHLVVQLGALLGRTSWSARVELRALAVPARRFLAVQLVAQVVALLGAGVATGGLQQPWLAPSAAAALGALLLWLAPRLSAPPSREPRLPTELRDSWPGDPPPSPR